MRRRSRGQRGAQHVGRLGGAHVDGFFGSGGGGTVGVYFGGGFVIPIGETLAARLDFTQRHFVGGIGYPFRSFSIGLSRYRAAR